MKRRDIAKLLGTTALLNSFPLMANEESHKKKLKKNLVLISTNYGFDPDRFMPKNDTLNSEYFKYYHKIKPKMTVFKRIEQNEMGGGHRSHHSIFTAQSKYNKITKPFVSLDQLIASRGIQETRHKFLSFSTGKSSQTCWSLSGQYIPPYSTYEAAFNGIFKDQVETKTLLEQKHFFSHFQASSLAKSKSDNYLRAMHELVQEIDTTIHWSQDKLPKTNTKYQFSKNEFMNLEGYLDLIYQAIKLKQCKLFNLNIAHGGTVDLDGVKEGYHKLTHNGKVPEMKRQLIKVEEYQLSKLSKFLEILDASGLLDETIVVVTGAFGNSNSHSTKDLPLFVAGGGLSHQGLVECKDKHEKQVHKLSDLYVTIANLIGIDGVESFAGYRGNVNKYFI